MRREKREQLKKAILTISDFCSGVPDCEDCPLSVCDPGGSYCMLIQEPFNWKHEEWDGILRLGEEDKQ